MLPHIILTLILVKISIQSTCNNRHFYNSTSKLCHYAYEVNCFSTSMHFKIFKLYLEQENLSMQNIQFNNQTDSNSNCFLSITNTDDFYEFSFDLDASCGTLSEDTNSTWVYKNNLRLTGENVNYINSKPIEFSCNYRVEYEVEDMIEVKKIFPCDEIGSAKYVKQLKTIYPRSCDSFDPADLYSKASFSTKFESIQNPGPVETENLKVWYFISNSKYTWFEAYNLCKSHNLDFASVLDSTENAFIRNTFSDFNDVWLGGSRLENMNDNGDENWVANGLEQGVHPYQKLLARHGKGKTWVMKGHF